MSKKRSAPAWGNASSDPTRPLVVPLNRAARKRYARVKGVSFSDLPALNQPRRVDPTDKAKAQRAIRKPKEDPRAP